MPFKRGINTCIAMKNLPKLFVFKDWEMYPTEFRSYIFRAVDECNCNPFCITAILMENADTIARLNDILETCPIVYIISGCKNNKVGIGVRAKIRFNPEIIELIVQALEEKNMKVSIQKLHENGVDMVVTVP